jgi:2-polyprenyl-3-methyl-5-hydroxy-6-metoxy-1,4-benzoquinol methylase
MTQKTTTELFIEHYHTRRRRASIEDPRVKKLAFRSLSRILGPYLPQTHSARILDVACGEGSLLIFLKELGFDNLSGFDLSPENVSICRRLGLDSVQEFDALRLTQFHGSDQYDRIFAMDILEHLPKQEAVGFVEQVRERLAPGGRAIFQTPNMGCIFGLLPRYCDITHEFALTETSAGDLFLAAGFEMGDIEIVPAWGAATALGRVRELYLRLLHTLIYLAQDSSRPRIATMNLLICASRPQR